MFYIIENQYRPDGVINNSTISRSNYDMALSYYYERLSKMLVNETFTKVALALLDSDLNYLHHEVINTRYEAEQEQ